jgi:hydrogenase maturation protease
MTRAGFLVLGLGNELFRDEGLGVEAARRVEALGLADVEVIDGGTLGLGLLPEIDDRRGVLVLDAVVAEAAAPGDLVALNAADLIRPHLLLYSAHQIGVQEALAAAQLAGRAPRLVAGIGMAPFSLETGYGLTTAALERLPAMVDAALDVLSSWGVEVPAHA